MYRESFVDARNGEDTSSRQRMSNDRQETSYGREKNITEYFFIKGRKVRSTAFFSRYLFASADGDAVPLHILFLMHTCLFKFYN